MAISRRRELARTSWRFATLAQAMRSTRPTAASTIKNPVRPVFTVVSSERIEIVRPAFSFG
jgi:hypothetical protein